MRARQTKPELRARGVAMYAKADAVSALRVGTDLADGRGVKREVDEGLRWLRVVRRLSATFAAKNGTRPDPQRARCLLATTVRTKTLDPEPSDVSRSGLFANPRARGRVSVLK